jgi:hypothetical protein
MQDHEAEGPKKVRSASQNEEVALTPMVYCNEESVIEEPSSLKKKTKHSFSVIKKSTKAKEAEPKSNEPDSSTSVPELGSTSKKGQASTTKNVVNIKKKGLKDQEPKEGRGTQEPKEGKNDSACQF